MYIHATSAFICDPIDNLDGLKSGLKNYTDFFFRRVNKFILLSLMGVHQCVHNKSIDRSVAVYLATENGNLGDTENVLHQLYKENSFPKPFNFINTMSNTASFYVAQSLKSLGRSITVSSKNVSFERGLDLACADFSLGHVTEALVGGVDEAVFSREHFINKYDPTHHDINLVEGSSWLYLKNRKEGALGEISSIKSFHEQDEAIDWVRHETVSSPTVLSFGIGMLPEEIDQWKRDFPHSEDFKYLIAHGYYDTVSAFAVSKFFEVFEKKTFVHVNKNLRGERVIIIARKY